MAAKAVALAEARQPAFQTYARQVADNAQSLAQGYGIARPGPLATWLSGLAGLAEEPVALVGQKA